MYSTYHSSSEAHQWTRSQPGHHRCKIPDINYCTRRQRYPHTGTEYRKSPEYGNENDFIDPVRLSNDDPLNSVDSGNNLHKYEDEDFGFRKKS
jgi:hypothetical protein